jgi:hypothetical protein
MVMVSPPVAFLPFDNCRTISGLKMVIAGTRDEFCPLGRIETVMPVWNPEARLTVIDGADHFFSGRTKQLEAALAALFL